MSALTPRIDAIEASIASGTYTPVITNKTGVLSGGTVTSFTAQYCKINDVVIVSGKLTVQATAGGDGGFNMSVPLSSSFSASEQCGGTWAISHPSTMYGIGAVASGTTVRFDGNFGTTGSQTGYFSFTYKKI